MSYDLAATITRGTPTLDRLKQIPRSIGYVLIGWNAYKHRQLDVCLLDVFSIRQRTSSAIQIEAFPLAESSELPSDLQTLQSLAAYLKQTGKEGGLDMQSSTPAFF
ncbi:MAG: hypothetical protein R3C05_01935 [Pirellulaceae bacterium]